VDWELLWLWLVLVVAYPKFLVEGIVSVSGVLDLVAVIIALGALWFMVQIVVAGGSLVGRVAMFIVTLFFLFLAGTVADWLGLVSEPVLRLIGATLGAGPVVAPVLGLLWRVLLWGKGELGGDFILATSSLATILTILVVLLAAATLAWKHIAAALPLA